MTSEDPVAPRRLAAIDTLRGVVMVLMALDHARDFFGVPGVNPVNLAQTTLPLFLTRWVTHICAPTLFLLTGAGAALALRTRSRAELSRFLLTRGVWLLLLEVTVIRCLGFQFNVDYRVTMLVVIWALGWAMIVLAGLVWLPLRVIATLALVTVAGHNLLDAGGLSGPLWIALHGQGVIVNRPGFVVFVAYPLIPWVAVTALGFALGRVYTWEGSARRAFLGRLGLSSIALFLVLRTWNVYGDRVPWAPQASDALTVVSYLNLSKYPPSLLFLLMTLGPALLLLRAFDRGTPRLLTPALAYGRVPLFYFVLHLFSIHLLAAGYCYWLNGDAHWLFESPTLAHYPFSTPPIWGLGLPGVYAVWVLVVALLYPACVWFAALKARSRGARWPSYF